MVNGLSEALTSEIVLTMGFRGSNQYTFDFNSSVECAQFGTSRLMFYGQLTPWEGIYTFDEIVADFLAGNDMQKYNNLEDGRCEITYMPTLFSDDSWIPSNLILPCFQVSVN